MGGQVPWALSSPLLTAQHSRVQAVWPGPQGGGAGGFSPPQCPTRHLHPCQPRWGSRGKEGAGRPWGLPGIPCALTGIQPRWDCPLSFLALSMTDFHVPRSSQIWPPAPGWGTPHWGLQTLPWGYELHPGAANSVLGSVSSVPAARNSGSSVSCSPRPGGARTPCPRGRAGLASSCWAALELPAPLGGQEPAGLPVQICPSLGCPASESPLWCHRAQGWRSHTTHGVTSCPLPSGCALLLPRRRAPATELHTRLCPAPARDLPPPGPSGVSGRRWGAAGATSPAPASPRSRRSLLFVPKITGGAYSWLLGISSATSAAASCCSLFPHLPVLILWGFIPPPLRGQTYFQLPLMALPFPLSRAGGAPGAGECIRPLPTPPLLYIYI